MKRDPKDIVINGKSLAEILALHIEWIEFYGQKGQRAFLHNADLAKANLESSNLREALLMRVNFRKACLVGANLREAYLMSADLCYADISNADFREADLRGIVNISKGKGLDSANFEGALLDEKTKQFLLPINETAKKALVE